MDKEFTLKWNGQTIELQATEKLLDVITNLTVKYNIWIACKMLQVASNYNYYDATANDIGAGRILVNNCEMSDDIVMLSKELLKLKEYKKLYKQVKQEHDMVRVKRGQEKFLTMLQNNCII